MANIVETSRIPLVYIVLRRLGGASLHKFCDPLVLFLAFRIGSFFFVSLHLNLFYLDLGAIHFPHDESKRRCRTNYRHFTHEETGAEPYSVFFKYARIGDEEHESDSEPPEEPDRHRHNSTEYCGRYETIEARHSGACATEESPGGFSNRAAYLTRAI